MAEEAGISSEPSKKTNRQRNTDLADCLKSARFNDKAITQIEWKDQLGAWLVTFRNGTSDTCPSPKPRPLAT
jgi:hypothetical protein